MFTNRNLFKKAAVPTLLFIALNTLGCSNDKSVSYKNLKEDSVREIFDPNKKIKQKLDINDLIKVNKDWSTPIALLGVDHQKGAYLDLIFDESRFNGGVVDILDLDNLINAKTVLGNEKESKGVSEYKIPIENYLVNASSKSIVLIITMANKEVNQTGPDGIQRGILVKKTKEGYDQTNIPQETLAECYELIKKLTPSNNKIDGSRLI